MGHAFTREGINFKAFNHFVFTILTDNGESVNDFRWNLVFAAGSNAHRDPFAVGAKHPVAHVIDGGIGSRCGGR